MRINLILIFFCLFIPSFNQVFAFDFFSKSEEKDEQKEAVIEKAKKIIIDQIDQNDFKKVAILRGLDKIIAKTSKLEIAVGEEQMFGKLSIEIKKCWGSPPGKRPENKILLKIEEEDKEGIRQIVFYGWIFSSSPSISGLEHPIYDITAIECVDEKTEVLEIEPIDETQTL
ncbi:MAG: hypothetical protein ACJA02_000993 [Myxococcota bacterium]|jgi:hypothetical protein